MQALVRAGMSTPQAQRKQLLFERALRALPANPTASGPLQRYFIPGRVEFLGKHTDYAGGRSLVCAVEQGICMVARIRPDRRIRVVAAATGDVAELALEPDLQIRQGEWSAFAATVARRLARDFPGLATGVELAFEGDLPPAAGLSSGSALVVGLFLALSDANRLTERKDFRGAIPPSSPEAIGDYLGAVENGRPYGPFSSDAGVGTLGGSQDQTTILCARPGMLLQFRWIPARLERAVPFPAEHCLAIGVSGVVAEKTGAARESYNAASRATAELLALWRATSGREDPTLAAALASAADAPNRLAALVERQAPELGARLAQFRSESEELIPAASEALARGDLGTLGSVVDRSQAGAESGLGNQVPETIYLQRSARRLGALAASAFGAGFGGSVWAMLESAQAGGFLARWKEDYAGAFPGPAESAQFFTTLPGPAALRF
jgi:galactokinase